MPSPIKIFLASSNELLDDRIAIRLHVEDVFSNANPRITTAAWEKLSSAMSPTRSQDEYNKVISDCEIFVLLFHTKVGKYTQEEFETALSLFQEGRNPRKIFLYKKVALFTPDENYGTVLSFEKRLNGLGHFCDTYKSKHELLLKLDKELDRFIDEKKKNVPINIAPKLVKRKNQIKKKRLEDHHKYRCNRMEQDNIFKIYFNKRKQEQRLHFFYFYGGEFQSHQGLFERFVNWLSGKDTDYKLTYNEANSIVKGYEIEFPREKSEEALKIEVPRHFMSELGIPADRFELIKDKNLAFVLSNSPYLNNLKQTDKVCFHISIPDSRWDKDITPQVSRWFIEKFCLEHLPTSAPEIFIFQSVIYDEENEDEEEIEKIKKEIEEAMKAAQYTIGLPELGNVLKLDVKEWFTDYREIWRMIPGYREQRKKWMNKVDSEMNMEDTQDLLQDIINDLNEDEKDLHKHSREDN